MRLELKKGNRSIFSHPLQTRLRDVLENDQQSILFLNRRGSSTYIFCRDCGESLRCPRCDTPLTFHDPPRSSRSLTPAAGEEGGETICHHCGYRRKMPVACPHCGSKNIRQYGTGTERVEAEIQMLFPEARTLRWDYDTTRQKGAHEVILNHFLAHRADILIGTQMLAKGLDLPLVTLVGVVLADVGLNLPDYHAAERTFQVLTQVAGRAGRSPLGGEVILQTYQPDHYVIRAAAGHDSRAFYAQELEFRRELGYPPFNQLARLEYRHTSRTRAQQAAETMATQVRGWIESGGRQETQLIGPVPCFFARIGGLHRWQIVLRGPDPASLLRGRQLGDWRVEVNPPSLL
jgi:primosomal protein N' (replication factor Y)